MYLNMAIIVIVKNNTGSSVFIEDLGTAVAGSGQRTLSDTFEFPDICVSENLLGFVANSTFTINDGTSDLNISEAQNHLNCKNADGGGTGASYLNDLLDVDTTSAGDQFSLVYNETTGIWGPGEPDVGNTNLPPDSTSTVWIAPEDNMPYYWNANIGDWVTINSDMYQFGKERKVDGSYIGIANHDGYYYVHRKGYIINVYCNIEKGNPSKAFEIHADESSIFNFSLTNSEYINDNTTIQIHKGEFLKLWCSPVGSEVERIMCQLVIKWSHDEE
jgi:hypothetical protein